MKIQSQLFEYFCCMTEQQTKRERKHISFCGVAIESAVDNVYEQQQQQEERFLSTTNFVAEIDRVAQLMSERDN